VQKGHTEAKEPMQVKGPVKMKGLTVVNFKYGGGQKKFSLSSLTNLSHALPLSK